jgi:hypothetical protein
MSVPEVNIEPGVCLGFGGSNARVGNIVNGDIEGFQKIDTPRQPDQFFSWMARQLLDASHRGSSWMVAGYPGLISLDGQWVGPMANVDGMSTAKFNLREELNNADSEVGRVIDEGFTLLAVNDGTLSAHSAADHYGDNKYGRVAALIVGTGIGTGVVDKDHRFANVYRADTRNAYEIGHIPVLGGNVNDTYETLFSGPAMKRRYDQSPEDLPAGHYVWEEFSGAVFSMVGILGCISTANLVMLTSGVGSGASDKYFSVLSDLLDSVKSKGNAPQKELFPEVIAVPPQECQKAELYGAEGVMREHRTASIQS